LRVDGSVTHFQDLLHAHCPDVRSKSPAFAARRRRYPGRTIQVGRARGDRRRRPEAKPAFPGRGVSGRTRPRAPPPTRVTQNKPRLLGCLSHVHGPWWYDRQIGLTYRGWASGSEIARIDEQPPGKRSETMPGPIPNDLGRGWERMT